MVIIGIDAHKKTHTAVAVNEVGRQLAKVTVKATSAGHLKLIRWAGQFDERRFAIEDCRHLTRRLEADLLVAGEAAVRVHPRLMAAERRGGRERGKSDPIDALAVARAALREPDLPVVEMDTETRHIRLLSDHRGSLVRERTALASRLRWFLHELAPEFDVRSRGLKARSQCRTVLTELDRHDGLVADLAREVVERIMELNVRINELERQLKPLVQEHSPTLAAVPGCGTLSAAKIIGETGRAGRFRSKDAYARFNGTAPVPVWSSNTEKVRLSRGGNRQINTALHMIAITQARGVGPGKAYLARRIDEHGDDRTAALRMLRRRLSDVVWRAMLTDEKARADNALAVAA